MGRKGGIRSGESRRRNKRLRETAKVMTEVFLHSEEGRKLFQKVSGTLVQKVDQSDEYRNENK